MKLAGTILIRLMAGITLTPLAFGAVLRAADGAPAGAVPAPKPGLAIGVVNSVSLAGKRLRLASDRDTPEGRVRDFVPPGETAEKWRARFTQREYARTVSPNRYATAVAELAASQGGKVVSTTAGPGESATVALVLHSLAQPVSEVSVWRFFIRDGRLICLQYTERIHGENHLDAAEAMAREKAVDWVRELQLQRPIALAAAVSAEENEE